MKQMIIIAIIIVLFGFTSLYVNDYLNDSAKVISNHIKNMEQYSTHKDWNKSKKELNTALTLWEKNKNKWSSLIEHQEIDKIEISMNRISKYLEVRDIPLLLGESASLTLLLKHIPNTYKLDFKNVF